MNGNTVPPERSWFKSSHSNPSNNCVEVMITDAVVHVRDTKSRHTGLAISVDPRAWRGFLAAMNSL